MDRKRYLELCPKNSISPNSVIVFYGGGQYFPLSLEIWFNGHGETRNTAKMMDFVSKTTLYADVKDVSE